MRSISSGTLSGTLSKCRLERWGKVSFPTKKDKLQAKSPLHEPTNFGDHQIVLAYAMRHVQTYISQTKMKGSEMKGQKVRPCI